MAKKGRRGNTGSAGEKHHNAKLTIAKVRRIKYLGKSSVVTHGTIARIMEIDRSVVGKIIRGKAWPHVV